MTPQSRYSRDEIDDYAAEFDRRMSASLEDECAGPLVALFVYGTLRPKEYNYFVEDACVDIVDNVTTNGWMVDNGSFPYATFGGSEILTGTLLLLRSDHDSTLAAHRMELGAQYDPVHVQVNLNNTGGSVGAIAYGIPESDSRMSRYPRIASGDWRLRDHEGRWNRSRAF